MDEEGYRIPIIGPWVPGAQLRQFRVLQHSVAVVDYHHSSNGLRYIGVDQVVAHLDEQGFTSVSPGIILEALPVLKERGYYPQRHVVSVGGKPKDIDHVPQLWEGRWLRTSYDGPVVRSFPLYYPGDRQDRPFFQTKFAVRRTIFLVEVP